MDTGEDRDNRDTDECVRTAITVSTPHGQLCRPAEVIRKLPLSGSSDTGEGTIWQIGVLKVFAGEWVGSVMMLPPAENSILEKSWLALDLRLRDRFNVPHSDRSRFRS
jgi:hypothetical protein